MSKLWKALGIAALAAAVVPCKVEKDEETGVKIYRTLLSSVKVGPGEDGVGTDVRLHLLGGVIPKALGKSEEEDYADEELEDMVTESIFEMKIERSVPAESENEEISEPGEAVEESEPEASAEDSVAPEELKAAEG